MDIGKIIMTKRKSLGYTQQALADKLNISFQAVSKWENGTSCPEIELLPVLAKVLKTSVDSLLDYEAIINSDYENRYNSDDYYWGLEPNQLCYEIMKLKPPTKPLKVLDIGCGEGKDAVFLARNGYIVSALDATDNGIHAMNVFVEKPFIQSPPNKIQEKNRFRWKSGTLFSYYYDWIFHKMDEVIFDCNSGGIPHKHCFN